MAKTSAEWSEQICSALANLDPQISTEIGDPIRKVIDACSSVAAAIDINSQVNMSFFDLDSKTGAELDAIASWLGFGRRLGIRAVGTVRFFIDEPATLSIAIPAGTQVTDGKVTFETTSSSVLAQYDHEVFVRVQCTTTGSAGNVNAYTINQVVSNVTSNYDLQVENQLNTSNGKDAESDAELRKRIRQTFLRNVAGTEDAYRGVSDKVNGTRRVNVVGPIERWEEQLQVVKLSDAQGGDYGFQSLIPCSKYTWPRQTYLVKEPGTPSEHTYKEGVEYEVDRSHDIAHPIVRIKMDGAMLDLDNKSGEELDKIGSALIQDNGTPLYRFGGSPATGTVSFGFDIALKSNLTIKAGARIRSAAGDVFQTLADTTIYSGMLGSAAVPVASEQYKAISIPTGTKMTYLDRTGFKVQVSKAISGGEAKWTDAVYRQKILELFGRKIQIAEGDFLFFKHEYTPIDSRNDPAANPPLVNKVDVFVDGQDTQQIREVSQIASVTLNNDTKSMWYCKNFYYEDGSQCVNGQKIEVLGYCPVVKVPDSFNVNGAMYRINEHYKLVKNQILTRGSVREIDALAWTPGVSIPSDGSFTEMTYDFNRTVFVTEQLLDTNRQICTDVLCHEAKRIGLTVNLIVQNVLGESDEDLLANVNALLDDWADNLEFGQWIQWSDLEMTVRQAMGVDACRIATAKDAWRTVTVGDNVGKKVAQGIQTHETYKSFLPKQHNEDFRLWESMIPEIYQVNIVRTASNTYSEDYKPV